VIPRTHTEKRLLLALAHAMPPEAVLRRCIDPARCTALYRALLVRATLARENGAAAFTTLLDEGLLSLSDPERAMLHLGRILDAAFSVASVLEMLTAQPRIFASLLRLLTASEWITDTLVRDAELLRWLLLEAGYSERSFSAMDAEARAVVARFASVAGRLRALRRFQRRELLRIAAADCLGMRELPSIVRELSALADVIVGVTWEVAVLTIEQRNHAVVSLPVVIFALGKLGGGELNYSSDIDLMVVYDTPEGAQQTGMHEIITSAVAEMLRLLSEQTQEGQLYRTDLRLRPDGAAGPLAISRQAALNYYEQRGADWERQMLLRARVCAGDAEFGRAFLRELHPFMLPRTFRRLPSDVFTETLERLAARWTNEDNVKHMRGGIRHIEFTLQALQRVHGAGDASVLSPSTLTSLDALSNGGYLTLEEHAFLRRAYLFLRRVEHAIMLDRFEQTHTLRRETAERARVAWLLRLDDAVDLDKQLRKVRNDVDRICAELMMVHEQSSRVTENIDGASSRSAVLPEALLRDLTDGRSGKGRDAAHRDRMRALLQELQSEIASEPLPQNCLTALENLLHRSTYPGEIITLLEQQRPRRVLLRLAALAPVMLRMFESDPFLLELMFSGWGSNLDFGRLRRVSETAAIAQLLTGAIDIAQCGELLSRSTDHILRDSIGSTARGEGLCVLAMGKYGNRERIPGSDLDVVFVHDIASIGTDEAQSAARAVILLMQQAGYAVDARLRPEGGSAPLSISLDAWMEYMSRRASLWEKQSLLRARVLAAPGLSERVNGCIDGVLQALYLTRNDVETIDAMRRKMEPENRFRREDFMDIKRSPGGLVDVEFAWQMYCLTLPAEDRLKARAAVMSTDGMPDNLRDPFNRLLARYHDLRMLQLRLRLLLDTPSNLYPSDEAHRSLLAGAQSFSDWKQHLDWLKTLMREIREDYQRINAVVRSRLEEKPLQSE
jgi:[glutamine synthetase] adenylyltransferase / [glutamine synthetase]-adenylyl-L-tyrosine phosphorylase